MIFAGNILTTLLLVLLATLVLFHIFGWEQSNIGIFIIGLGGLTVSFFSLLQILTNENVGLTHIVTVLVSFVVLVSSVTILTDSFALNPLGISVIGKWIWLACLLYLIIFNVREAKS